MTPTGNFKGCKNSKHEKRAFTLIELLFVLLISFIVLAAAIPRIRMVSKDRAIRETSRIVGSMFTKAREEAMINGRSGIVLRRNSNFAAKGQWYASTKLGILRAVPKYVGDQPYAKGANPIRGATRSSHTEVDIPIPIEQKENPPVVAGDSISLNYSPVQYLIKEVSYDFSEDDQPILRLELEVNSGGYPSIPPEFEDVPFAIHRQPILRQSSLEELPRGYLIDLRYSGAPVFDSDFNPSEPEFENYEIEFIFNNSGAIDKVLYWELDAQNFRTGCFAKKLHSSSVYLLVTEALLSPEESPLASELAMWVKIAPYSITPTVGYNTPQQDSVYAAGPQRIEDVVDRARGNAGFEANP